jgi:hypothetical protein
LFSPQERAMLTIRYGPTGDGHTGPTRRGFLRVGAFGGFLTLADLLRARAAGAKARNEKAVIVVFLAGGPSQLDTYDLKPDAPQEFRGLFDPIPTNVPGIEICEYLEKHAECMDKMAILRAVVAGAAGDPGHSDSVVMSGWTEAEKKAAGRPSVGAVVSKVRGFRRPDVPPFVSLRGLTFGLEPGDLGIAHRAFNPSEGAGRDLRLPPGVDLSRLEDRKALLEGFDTMRRDLDAKGELAGMDAFRQRAFAMIASDAVRRALDVTGEDPRVRESYGPATEFLVARRLVQAGVGFVTLLGATGVGEFPWDTHGGQYPTLKSKTHLPFLDRAVPALVEDLHRLGLEKDVLVVVWGEFGRTPRINQNAGRDHWPNVMSVLLAGGGLKMGQVVGSTTSKGEEPKTGRYHVENVLATVYHALGIDPALTYTDRTGRPQHLLDDRDLIKELL